MDDQQAQLVFKFKSLALQRSFNTQNIFINSFVGSKPRAVEDNKLEPSINSRLKPAKTVKGFDFYFRKNLRLDQVNKQDIQVVNSFKVLYEEDIHLQQQPQTTKYIPNLEYKQSYKAKTEKNFQKSKQNQFEEKKSRQAELNDFLFQYRKQQQEKKHKKMKFLEEVERKLNYLQKQANSLNNERSQQFNQLQDILQIHSQAAEVAKKAEIVGNLDFLLHQINQQRIQKAEPARINENMQIIQINAAIQQHHEYNNYLLDEIERVQSRQKNNIKSPKKGHKKNETYYQQQKSLSKTLKRPMQLPPKPTVNKKLTTTWKGK